MSNVLSTLMKYSTELNSDVHLYDIAPSLFEVTRTIHHVMSTHNVHSPLKEPTCIFIRFFMKRLRIHYVSHDLI